MHTIRALYLIASGTSHWLSVSNLEVRPGPSTCLPSVCIAHLGRSLADCDKLLDVICY
jgi:hypothetical protein